MKREPNPYSKNPRLTVTSTMAISVPSMVAEDVLNGTDAPVITVDPNVNDRIDTISGAVELMDTRIDTVSEMANLTNTNLYNLAEFVDGINTRVDNVSKVASLGGTSASESGRDISFTTSGGTDYSLGFKVNANSNDRSAIVSLTSTGSNEFSGIAALGTWLSAPSYQIGSVGTCMAVSGMGTLVFKHMDDTAIYDLNNLGGGSGSAAGVYELDLWDNGSDSGSQMLPLVKASNIEAARDVSVLNWTVGTSTSDAADASGMYTLIGNPIALYDSAYRGSNNSRIKGAVRVVDMHGTICWQRYSYTNKQWEIEPTEEILPDGVTMELLPYNPAYEQRKGRLARFTSSDGPLMATAPGIGLYTGNQSIVACLTAKSYDSSINKTTWKDYYIEYEESTDNGHSFMDITELIGRRQQLCDIASHLSQIRWLCENTAALYALVNK